MTDIIIESLLAFFLLAIIILLWRRREHYDVKARQLMLAGFSLLFFASLLDLSDNFTSLNTFIVTGDTPVETFVEKLFGYLLGTLLIFLGFLRLAPISDKLEQSLVNLQESRDRFRLAMEGSSGGYWDWNAPKEQETIWLSDRLYELLGYEPGEFPANIAWVRDAIHPDDRELVRSAFNAHLHLHAPFHTEYRIRTKRGEYRWFQARGQASWDEHGNPIRMSGSIEDITDRKHYQHAINHLTSGVATYTGHSYLDNLVMQLHDLFEVDCVLIAMLEDIGAEQLNTITLCVDGHIVDNISWNIDGSPGGDVIAAGTACTFRTRVREKFPDDTVLETYGIQSYIGIPLFSPDGSTLGLMALMDRHSIRNDLFVIEIAQLFADRAVAEVERIQAESELLMHREHLEDLVVYRTEELRRSNKELESFSYSVSHDLRGPLRAIDGFSESLLEDCGAQLDATAHDYLQRIRKNTRRMGQLIDDLLILSRVTRHEINDAEVDLSGLCRDIIEQLQAENPEHGVAVSIQPDIHAWGDPNLLRIVMENLISNAWKYTGKTPDATITFCTGTRDGQTIYQLADNGAGFDMKYADKLFEVFQRLHGSHDFEGTGVGLATVKRVIDRHGGSIWAQSRPGEGAQFYFTLPDNTPARSAAY